jgi:glucose-1-phosphate cytidylyltransferase
VRSKKLAAISIVRPSARCGAVKLKNNNVNNFEEKNSKNQGWVNGGFMACESEIFMHFNKKSSCVLKKVVFNSLIRERNLSAFKYHDFW